MSAGAADPGDALDLDSAEKDRLLKEELKETFSGFEEMTVELKKKN